MLPVNLPKILNKKIPKCRHSRARTLELLREKLEKIQLFQTVAGLAGW